MRILITGATSGIGRACAEHLAANGHTVIATGRNPQALSELEDRAKNAGWHLHALRLDVTVPSEVAQVADDVKRRFGGIDALMNNAGYGQAGFLADVSGEQLREQFSVSLFGLFDVTRAFLPQLMASRGTVINVGSIMGRMTAPWMGTYGAVKAAVKSLTETMRVELAAVGVRVVLLEPGSVDSGFHERAVGERRETSPVGSPFAASNTWLRDNDYSPLFMMRSVPALSVARLVRRIVESHRPRARYVTPLAARFLLFFMAAMPIRFLDPLKRRIFHVTGSPETRPA